MTSFGPRLRSVAGAFAAALLIYLLPGCREIQLRQGEMGLAFHPQSLDYGFVYRGAESYLSVNLVNSSRGRINVTWDALPAPFFADELPSTIDVGQTELTLRFRPTEWGERTSTLIVRDGLTVLARLPLRGVGQNIPDCPTPVACHETYFDLGKGECVERALKDGAACDSGSKCVLTAACRAGQCVGEALACDDGNACTIDLCNPLSGCETTPAPPCPSNGACTVGVCDPVVGCTTRAADDGTVCGDVTCDSADVCIFGACVKRDPPDGFRCAEATPCRQEGVCQGSACAQPPPAALTASFSFASNLVTENNRPVELHDILMEPNGSLSLAGFYEKPRLRINTSAARSLSDAVRRCILWNGRLACADHALTTAPSGSIAVIDLASGETVWKFNLVAARADFAAQVRPGNMFMARLAVLGPDRLLALFEAYPKGSPPDTQCRVYFLVLLNAAGQMVTASKMVDPALETCDHPHPYGVVADAAGNFYMSFSSSTSGSAPLSATAPTKLFAYSREGLLLWKRAENFVGGELAVARGVLFNERSNTAFITSSGAPLSLGGQSRPLGRIVATNTLFIPSPTSALSSHAQSLTAYRLQGGAQAWTYQLAAGETFVSPEIRAATWKARPTAGIHNILLGFINTAPSGELRLEAIDSDNGKKLWSCAVNAQGATTPPQLFELANGSFATMDSAVTCGDCDPPFALSSGHFRAYVLEGVGQADVPWSGTLGGAGHPHREQAVYGALVPQQ